MNDPLLNNTIGQIEEVDPSVAGVAYLPKTDAEQLEISKFESFGAGLKQTVGIIPRAIYDSYVQGSTFDSNYNPFEDGLLKNRGEEFVTKYGKDFMNSPSAAYTQQLLNRIDEYDVLNSAITANPVSGFTGFVAGAVADPLNFVPGIGKAIQFQKAYQALKGASTLGKVAGTSAIGAATGALYGSAFLQYDPNYEVDNLVADTVLGGMLGGVLGLASSKELGNLYKSYMTKDNPTELTLSTPSIGGKKKKGRVKKEVLPNPEQSSMAFGTEAGEALSKYVKYASPNQKLLNSQYGTAKYFAGVLGEYSGVTKGNVEGIATPNNIGTLASSGYSQKMVSFDNALDDLELQARKKGDKRNRAELLRDSIYDYAVKGKADGMSGTLKKFFDNYFDELKVKKVFNKDAVKPAGNYIMHRYDWNKITNNYTKFANILYKKIEPQMLAEGKSPAEITKEAYKIMDDLKSQDLSNLNSSFYKNYIPKSTISRTLNLENGEAWEFLRDDWDDAIRTYTHQMETQLAFKRDKFLGKYENPYEGITNLVEKERTEKTNALLAKLEEAKANGTFTSKLEDELNKEINLIRTEAEDVSKTLHELIDTHTLQVNGKQGVLSSPVVQSISTVLRTYNLTRLMGSNAITQLGDFARVYTAKMFEKFKANEFLTEIKKDIISLSPDDRALLNYSLENTGKMNRADALYGTDTIGTDSGRIGRVTSGINNLFMKYTGVAFLNRLSNTITETHVVNNVLNSVKRLLADQVEKGSFESIELARFGIDKAKGKALLEQYEKYKIARPEYGDNFYDLNLKDWDSEVLLEFQANVLRYVNRIIINPTAGSKYHFFNTAVGKLIGQFKGWTFGAFEATLMNNVQTAGMTKQHSNAIMSYFIMSSMAGSMVQMLQDTRKGKEIEITPQYLASGAWQYGGFFPMLDIMSSILDQRGAGVMSVLGQQHRSRFVDQNVFDTLLGVSYGLGKDVPRAVEGAAELTTGDFSEKDWNAIRKVLPFQNYILFEAMGAAFDSQ